MLKLEKIIENPPLLHQEGSGNLTSSWKLSDEILQFIDQNISSNSRTLETGAGISTILFALKSTDHTCIVPDQQQIDRIKQYCEEHHVSTDKIDFKIDLSENVMPYLNVNDLDCVLIDGSHGFPVPFIDWFYTSEKLKVGGILIVDDTQIFTGKLLKDFLISEPEWKFRQESSPRSAIFIKERKYINNKDWHGQPYTIKKSRLYILGAKIKTAIKMVSTGNFEKLTNYFRKFSVN